MFPLDLFSTCSLRGERRQIISRPPQGNRAAGDSIDDIVVSVWAVINGVLTGAGDPAFQADDLRHQPIVARQHDATAVQKRQKIAIEIALGTFARFVSNAVLAE